MRWAGHVARIEEMTISYKIIVPKSEENEKVARQWRRSKKILNLAL
jgi:hypothetical protein